MFEKAIAKYNIDPGISWMVGNSERDMVPAHKLGIKTIFVGNDNPDFNIEYKTKDLLEAAKKIIAH